MYSNISRSNAIRLFEVLVRAYPRLGRYKPASVLHATLARALFVSVLLMACSRSPALAQHNHRNPGYIDSEQLALSATRERLTQHENSGRISSGRKVTSG